MQQWWVSVLPVLGVVAGILFQHFLSKTRYRSEKSGEARHETYSKYLEAVAKRDLPALTVAKTQLTVLGSTEVIERIAAFERLGAVLDNDQSQKALMAVVEQMRTDVDPSQRRLADADVGAVLFGTR